MLRKLLPEGLIWGTIFGLKNVSNSVQTSDAEKAKKMTPKWIQNKEQMSLKRMPNQCIFWKGDFAQSMLLEMISNSFCRLRVQQIDPQIITNKCKIDARTNVVKLL